MTPVECGRCRAAVLADDCWDGAEVLERIIHATWCPHFVPWPGRAPLVPAMPDAPAERWRWLVDLDTAIADDAIRTAEGLLDQTDDVQTIHEVTLGLARYLSARIASAVEMGVDTWAATL